MATKTPEAPTTEIIEWDGIDGIAFEDDGSEEIKVSFPLVSIVQGTSKFPGKGTHGGHFWHSDTESYTPELNVIALQMSYGQALFEEGKVAPSCSSADGRVPRPNSPLWLSEDGAWQPQGSKERINLPLPYQPLSCEGCPLSAWGQDNTPPLCARSILLLIEREDGSYAQIRLSGTAIKPFQQFVSRKLVYKNKRLPLFAMRLRLWCSEENDGPQKSWFQLHVDGTPLPAADIRLYNDLIAAQRGNLRAAIEDSFDAPAPTASAPANDPWAGADDLGINNPGNPPNAFED